MSEFQHVSPKEAADRLLSPGNTDVGYFALRNTRSVVPRKGVSEPKDPKEDVIDEDKDRDK